MISRRAKWIFLFHFITVLALWACPGAAQSGAYHLQTGAEIPPEELRSLLPPTFDLFGPDEELALELHSDFQHFVRKKYDPEYQPAELVFHLNDTVLIRREVRIKARGHSRKEICYFPPVWINFKQTEFLIEGLQELSKMKMVSYCKNSKANEAYVLKEYLVYKMLNLLTPTSFQVRLIRMKYVDTGRKNKTLDGYAFLLEPVKHLKKRLNARELEEVAIHPKVTEQHHMALIDLFQFMIGNCDWSVIKLHNMKMLQSNELQPAVYKPVPYDFDYSGMVNAHYALPPDNLDIKSVTDRLYRGFCHEPEINQSTRQLFLERKEALFELIEGFEPLDDKPKGRMLKYLEAFYKIAEKPDQYAHYVERSCRTGN